MPRTGSVVLLTCQQGSGSLSSLPARPAEGPVSETMRIFLGSSREASESGLLRIVAAWIEQEGHEPVRWNAPGVFPAGAYTFQLSARSLVRLMGPSSYFPKTTPYGIERI